MYKLRRLRGIFN